MIDYFFIAINTKADSNDDTSTNDKINNLNFEFNQCLTDLKEGKLLKGLNVNFFLKFQEFC